MTREKSASRLDGNGAVTRPPRFRRAFFSAAAIGLILWLIAFIGTISNADLGKNEVFAELGKAGASLAILTVLGGLVKVALSERDRELQRLQETWQFIRNMLADLKSVYDRVEGCRLLIEAQRSAKTYREQIASLVEGVIILHKIKRALDPEWPNLKWELTEPLNMMIGYLKAVIREFHDHYRSISRIQEAEEAWNKAQRERLFADKKTPEDYSPKDLAWAAIAALPVLRDLRDDAKFETYKSGFLDHLDEASRILRQRLPVAEPDMEHKDNNVAKNPLVARS